MVNNATVKKYICLLCLPVILLLLLSACSMRQAAYASDYMLEKYNGSVQKGDLFASNLCVLTDKTNGEEAPVDAAAHGYALFNTDNNKTITWYKADESLFPASTTKLMTALLALKSGKLDETVTVSQHAVEDLEEGSSVANLKPGDQLPLSDVLYGLVMQSGNDAAVAIAEFLADGSEADFVKMMNDEAQLIGATKTHFMNPHGLHEEKHYTTVYDLYLIFNECLKYDEFRTIISAMDYNTSSTASDGTMRSINWEPTNYYALGEADPPKGITIIGGKTGTTDEAGCCLVLLSQNEDETPYISIVMGAADKHILYADMNELMEMEKD